jgi:hypothetical protein
MESYYSPKPQHVTDHGTFHKISNDCVKIASLKIAAKRPVDAVGKPDICARSSLLSPVEFRWGHLIIRSSGREIYHKTK